MDSAGSHLLADSRLCRLATVALIALMILAGTAAAQRPLGIDVSYWQGDLSQATWNNVYAAGRSFAFVRCTHWGVGGGDPDPYFATNMLRARAAGLQAGAYHFARPSVRDPQTEANYFVNYATQYWTQYGPNFITTGYMRPVLDLEEAGGTTPVGAASLAAWANAWLNAVQAQTGVEPIVYCNSNYARNYLDSSLASRTLWIANYSCSVDPQTGTPPNGIGIWSNWTFWQYCSSLSVGGITPVDTDVFNGTAAQLLNYVINGGTNPPVISNVQSSNIVNASATVTWTTDVSADSQVEYGTTTAYGTSTTLNPSAVTAHTVLLTGLVPRTLYHYRVRSANGNGPTYSGDYTFTSGSPLEILIDNTDSGCTATGTWSVGTLANVAKIGTNYLYKAGTGSTTSTTGTVRWTPNITAAGAYDVYVYYQLGSNRNNAAPYTIVSSGGSLSTTQNQYSTTSSGNWFKLNATPLTFAAGTGGYVQVANNSLDANLVSADAAKFVRNDTQPPTVPTNVTATAASTTSIQLNWTASTDDVGVVGYNIYRNTVAVGTSTTPSFLDTGLPPNTTCSYRISAFDGSSNESAQSTPAVSRATLSVPPGASTVVANTYPPCAGGVTWTAVGGFGAGTVQYYRYSWDQNPTATFSGSEPQWSAGTLQTSFGTGGTWYLHVQGYNADNVANGTFDYVAGITQHVAADLDGDCDVDAEDMTLFAACLGGPGVPFLPGCNAADLDGDNDVDQADFGRFQRCYSGTGVAADPNCAG